MSKTILDDRNFYKIAYHRDDLTQGTIHVMILESGWWIAFDTIGTKAELYIDNLVDFVRNELFNQQVRKEIELG